MNADYVLIIITIALLIIMLVIGVLKKGFKCLELTEMKGNGRLAGQIKHGISSALLPNPIGISWYVITINRGRALLVHHSYNPDGGTYSLPPGNYQKEYMSMDREGTYTFIIEVSNSSGKPDCIELINANWLDDIDFDYIVN